MVHLDFISISSRFCAHLPKHRMWCVAPEDNKAMARPLGAAGLVWEHQ